MEIENLKTTVFMLDIHRKRSWYLLSYLKKSYKITNLINFTHNIWCKYIEVMSKSLKTELWQVKIKYLYIYLLDGY